ncbi:hypothetical protein AB0I84_44230 [Streptomyces spectabilis]|uniref:Uncharacterized protein n=1 Tax=Streptomyces spectabilis TaxID=68270 RepID=A0A7W8ETZ7_STRST|nr:hypothetical protein [Streptomyces spectabilis]MBB5105312.1 hypothetical protein [Streptomyces spectabilis]MCI3906505.1 hypothetical protein [Streptomyces spectabilis]GGV20920.1 hypothetical protein GCM10010245_35090 [Streptomyces spectabilis]
MLIAFAVFAVAVAPDAGGIAAVVASLSLDGREAVVDAFQPSVRTRLTK